MTHCAFCASRHSGYPDGHWEDFSENLQLCKKCVENVALGLMEQGKEHLINEKLRKQLEKQRC